jgi:transposase-like protein
VDYNSDNGRNSYNRKIQKDEHRAIEIETPSDCNVRFDPGFVAKNQTRLTKFDDRSNFILC